MKTYKIIGAIVLWIACAYLVAAVVMSSMVGEWGNMPFLHRLVFLIPAYICFHFALKLTLPKSWNELG
jgi:hypothetical protein